MASNFGRLNLHEINNSWNKKAFVSSKPKGWYADGDFGLPLTFRNYNTQYQNTFTLI